MQPNKLPPPLEACPFFAPRRMGVIDDAPETVASYTMKPNIKAARKFTKTEQILFHVNEYGAEGYNNRQLKVELTPKKVLGKSPYLSHTYAQRVVGDATHYLKAQNDYRPAHPIDLLRVPWIRVRVENTIGFVTDLGDHMSDFPYQMLVKRFVQNGIADVEQRVLSAEARSGENQGPDPETFVKERRFRAGQQWDHFRRILEGTYPVNSVFCIMPFASELSVMMTALQDDAKSRFNIDHVLVVRTHGLILLLMSAAENSASKRFPFEWFLRMGEVSSSFMFLSI